MTNAEMYQAVFGFPPDKANCPTECCYICPGHVEECLCTCTWWDEEYKGTHAVKIEITEHHTFATPDGVENLDFPNASSENK